MVYYTAKEKLDIVMDMVSKLRHYKNDRGEAVNLMNEHFSFVNKLKEIMNKYVREDGSEYKGFLEFEEIGKKIEYYFPASNKRDPTLVIRQNK
jgi:hypothetical protein